MATNKQLHDILFPKADLTLGGFEYICKDCTEDKNCNQCYEKEIPDDIRDKILSLFFKNNISICFEGKETGLYILTNKEKSEVVQFFDSIMR